MARIAPVALSITISRTRLAGALLAKRGTERTDAAASALAITVRRVSP